MYWEKMQRMFIFKQGTMYSHQLRDLMASHIYIFIYMEAEKGYEVYIFVKHKMNFYLSMNKIAYKKGGNMMKSK